MLDHDHNPIQPPTGHSNALPRPIPDELLGVDRFLAQSLAPGRERDPMRVERIFAASRGALPAERFVFPRSATSIDSVRESGVGRLVRRARVAVAVAAILTLATGSIVTLRQVMPTGAEGESRFGEMVREIGREPSPSPDFTRPGATEATLIALLTDASGDSYDIPSSASWIDDRAFRASDAGRAVAPVLQTRGAGIDDFVAELGSILDQRDGSAADGSVDVRPM